MRSLVLSLFVTLSITKLVAQSELLQSGPMVGYSEMREVAIWVQTKVAAKVQIAYWNKAGKSDTLVTDAFQTEKINAYSAKLIVDRVEPGQKYGYRLSINGKSLTFPYPTEFQTLPLWQWRTDPPAFTVAAGSCTYVNEDPYDRPGRPYGGSYEIFRAIHEKRPDMMLWLGDNIYLREVDWNSRTGILHRNTHSRSLPELQPLLASTHNYAIWDDHDFGPNDADGSFVHKDLTLEAFKLFWANPSFGINGEQGITSQFQWGDIDFFLLDNRYFRSSNDRKTGKSQILGEAQIEWLISALKFSRSPFKMVAVGGQVLNSAPVYENFSNKHAAEREYLLKRIEEEQIKGVIFLTGDRHHTELSRWQGKSGIVVYDFTISPLTASAARTGPEEPNIYRVQGTFVNQRNFALMEFSGVRTARALTLKVLDVEGNELWTKHLKAGE
jgi:alkaline phosphatase D